MKTILILFFSILLFSCEKEETPIIINKVDTIITVDTTIYTQTTYSIVNQTPNLAFVIVYYKENKPEWYMSLSKGESSPVIATTDSIAHFSITVLTKNEVIDFTLIKNQHNIYNIKIK